MQGWRQTRRCRNSSGITETVEGKAAELRRRGFVRFDHHIDPTLLASVRDGFDASMADDTKCRNLGLGDAESNRYLVDPNLLIPEIASLFTAEVQRVVASAYGSAVRVRHIRAYRNTFPSGADPSQMNVYGNVWHLDPEIVCDLRYFVYLTDPTTARQGALAILDRRTTRAVMRSGYLPRGRVVGPARRRIARNEAGAIQQGVLGTAILIDAQRCLHRAGIPEPGEHRDIVQFWLTPAMESMPGDWASKIRDPAWSVPGYLPGDG